MTPVSLQQVPPAAYPAFNGDASPRRIHYPPAPIPSIEQIFQKQAHGQAATGDDADQLLAALKQDNRNLEYMLAQLTALAVTV